MIKIPGYDGTGPRGQGARTGRGLGICNGYDPISYMNPFPCRLGLGFRRRNGRNR